jgi:hypothetical protein
VTDDNKSLSADFIEITLFFSTPAKVGAGTNDSITVYFVIGGNPTDKVPLVRSVPDGANVSWTARLSGWPSKIGLVISPNEALEVDFAMLYSELKNASLFTSENGSTKVINGTMEIDVPPLNCVTQYDPRIEANTYVHKVSSVGATCIFGVDDRDEGYHCIYSDGDYGSNGWCYTDVNRESWGSCTSSCPLYGKEKVLGAKIDGLTDKLGKILDKVSKTEKK